MTPRMKLLYSFFSLLKPSRLQLLGLAALTALLALFDLAKPYLTGVIVDMAGRAEFSARFYQVLLALGALFAVGELAAVFKTLSVKRITSRLQLVLSLKTFNLLYRRPFAESFGKSPGESFYKTTEDVDRAAGFMTETAAQLPYLALRIALTLGIILKLSFSLAVLAALLLPLMLLPQHLLKKKMLASWEKLIGSAQSFFSLSEELFAGTYLVKAMGKEKTALRRFCGRLALSLRAEIAGLKVSAWLGMASRLAALAAAALFLVFALRDLQAGRLSLGTLAALAIYIMQLNSLAAQAAEIIPDIALGLLSCARLEGIFTPQEKSVVPLPPVTHGAAEFSGVCFSYEAGKPVLKNASFQLKPCTHTVLLGPSGCGKTTVFNLLLGLYAPQSGNISIDGAPVPGPRPNTALAPQESYFWNDSLRNNLLFAAPNAQECEINIVLELAGLQTLVESLPQGIDTPLGHNAARLSRGQKQRLALARALMQRPVLLLLDEALSSLDMESETAMLKAVRRNYPAMTIVSAAHRPQSALLADCACVFDGHGGISCGLSPEEALRRAA